MRLLRVDAKSDKVTEIKTFEPLKSKYAAIATAMEQDPDGGKYLLDEGDGGYYEFDVRAGEDGTVAPHFLPGNEGYHEGVPEKHLARIQRTGDSLKETKDKYGDFLMDTAGAAPDENPFNAPPAPTQEELDAIAAAEAEGENREVLDPNAPEETETPEDTDAPVTEEETTETPEGASVDAAEGESAEEAGEASTEPIEGAEETNAVEQVTEETVEEPTDGDEEGAETTETGGEVTEGGDGDETTE